MPRRSTSVCDTKRLIDLVYSYPMIYDLMHRDYRDVARKERIWQGIGQDIGVSGDVVKKRWKNLKDCYRKYLYNQPGKAKRNNSYDSWKWAAEMHPFKLFFQNDETERDDSADTPEVKNVVTDNTEIHYNDTEPKVELTYDYVDSNDHDYQDNIEEEQNALLIVRKEKLFSKMGLNTTSGTSCTETDFEKLPIKRKKLDLPGTERNIEYLQGNIEPESDDTDLLMLGFAKSIKKLSRKRQITAKRKISEIVFDLEMEELEEH